MKYKNKKRKSLNEFRYNYDTKHMNYIFEEEGKRYHSVSVIERFKIIEDYYKWLSANEYDANSAIVFVRYKDYLLKGLEK